MALIIRDRFVMTFLQKSGSTWIEAMIEHFFSRDGEVRSFTIPMWCDKHVPLSFFNERYFRVLSVREPLEWHRSWWAFNKSRENQGINMWHSEEHLNDDSFEAHIDKVLKHVPNYYTNQINSLLGGLNKHKLDAVIRQENIEAELVKALNKGLGMQLTVDDLKKQEVPKVLVTPQKFKDKAVYREDQPKKILEANKTMVQQFYRNKR